MFICVSQGVPLQDCPGPSDSGVVPQGIGWRPLKSSVQPNMIKVHQIAQ